MAVLYEQYHFIELKYEYKTEASTSTNGYTAGAVDYDCTDPAPGSKVEMMNMNSVSRSPIWSNFVYDCSRFDMDAFNADRYIRSDPIDDSELLVHDLGNFYIIAQLSNGNDDFQAGELYVTYEVVLKIPTVAQTGIQPPEEGQVVEVEIPEGSSVGLIGGDTHTLDYTKIGFNDIHSAEVDLGLGTVRLPPGEYEVGATAMFSSAFSTEDSKLNNFRLQMSEDGFSWSDVKDGFLGLTNNSKNMPKDTVVSAVSFLQNLGNFFYRMRVLSETDISVIGGATLLYFMALGPLKAANGIDGLGKSKNNSEHVCKSHPINAPPTRGDWKCSVVFAPKKEDWVLVKNKTDDVRVSMVVKSAKIIRRKRQPLAKQPAQRQSATQQRGRSRTRKSKPRSKSKAPSRSRSQAPKRKPKMKWVPKPALKGKSKKR